jgi:hypothetical protein
MTVLNAREVEAAINELGREEFIEAMEGYSIRRSEGVPSVELSLGKAEFVDAKWGAEGEGEYIWVVFRIGDELFQLDGYYGSWDGSSWEEGSVSAVEAKEVVKTIYVAKQ